MGRIGLGRRQHHVGRRASRSATRCPASSRRIRFESGACVKQGQVLVELDSQRRARAARVGRGAPGARDVERRAHARRSSPTRRHRPGAARHRRGAAQDRPAPTSTALQAQIDRKVVRAPFAGRLGIRAGQPRPVPEPGHDAHRCSRRSTRCSSTSRCRSSSSRRSRSGMPVRVTVEAARRSRVEGDDRRDRPRRRSRRRARSSCAPASPTRTRSSGPGMFVNVAVVLPEQAKRRRGPGDRGRARVLRRLGLHRRGQEGRQGAGRRRRPTASRPRSRASSSCALGEARGDFVAIADGREGRPGGRQRRAPSSCATAPASSSTTTSSSKPQLDPQAREPLRRR